MLQGLRIPGRTKPRAIDIYRSVIGPKVEWLIPERSSEKGLDLPGVLVCPRCHAISFQKRWLLDEEQYQRLRSSPGTHLVICPGCRRIERQEYEGEVRLRSPLLRPSKQQALAIIRHEEEKARENNPFHKSFKGSLELQFLPDEKFVRVRWDR